MSAGTKIEWADETWNPVSGCSKVSPGCELCYIERTPPFRIEHRKFDRPGIGGTTGVTLHRERLAQPIRWRKPRRVFVCSLADLFHGDVPDDYIDIVFAVMALTPHITYQVLTKRHARMRSLLSNDGFVGSVDRLAGGIAQDNDLPCPDEIPWPLPNVWLGVTAENQKWAGIRVPALLDTPAAVRWVSAEPMLGWIDLGEVGGVNALYPDVDQFPGVKADPHPRLDWVVVGTESGPGARPADLTDVGVLVAQCLDAAVPVLVKQLPTGKNGRATQDIETFPEHLRVREYPRTA